MTPRTLCYRLFESYNSCSRLQSQVIRLIHFVYYSFYTLWSENVFLTSVFN